MTENQEFKMVFRGIPEGHHVEVGITGYDLLIEVVKDRTLEEQRVLDQKATTKWLGTPPIGDEDQFPDEVEQAHAEQSEKKPVGGTLEDGYYYTEIFDREHEENGFVEVWKVVTSQTSGKPYAKKLDMASGRFEYAPGAMKHLVSEATPLSLEIAKKYGALYGRCMICGRTLTDEGSIEAGIGPICAGRL